MKQPIFKSNFVVIIALLLLFSCKKKPIYNELITHSDTMQSGNLELTLYQTKDTIKMKTKSLVDSATMNYKFVFAKKHKGYELLQSNMFAYFDVSSIHLLGDENIDTILYQSNELYDSELQIIQEEINHTNSDFYTKEDPLSMQSFELIYDNNRVYEVNLHFFDRHYRFNGFSSLRGSSWGDQHTNSKQKRRLLLIERKENGGVFGENCY